MKKHRLTLLFVLSLTLAFGQKEYEPQILVLAPNETKYDKSFEKEISSYNAELKKNAATSEQEQEINSAEFKKQPENIQIITKSEFEFLKNVDFFKQASLIAEQYLAYRFFEKFPNLLVKLKDAKSKGSLEDLKAQSQNENLQYVLNFASIELYKEERVSYAKIKVQLYDKVSHSLLLDKTYIGDWSNPGFEFACEEKSINCTLNNALSKALGDIIRTIASNSPSLKRESQLKQERYTVLMDDYFERTYDRRSVQNIISTEDRNININDVYHVLYSSDNTKFLAFFIEAIGSKDFKTFKDSKQDKNVEIISSKETGDAGFFEQKGNMYAYIVKGVKYKDKWYYEKSKVTYFDAKTLLEGQQKFFNNLQKWNFFQENSTEFNPDFWETALFAKVPDLTKDPDWEKYGTTSWATRELNNRPYIGLYEIVADRLRVEKDELAEKTEKELIDKYVIPLTTKLKTQHIYELVTTKHVMRDYLLVYATDFKYILCPIIVQEPQKEKFIRYFVLVPNGDTYKIYEWTYLNPSDFKNSASGPSFMSQMNTVTTWNFSYDVLDDTKFWNDYVFVKTAESYKYLTEMK